MTQNTHRLPNYSLFIDFLEVCGLVYIFFSNNQIAEFEFQDKAKITGSFLKESNYLQKAIYKKPIYKQQNF